MGTPRLQPEASNSAPQLDSLTVPVLSRTPSTQVARCYRPQLQTRAWFLSPNSSGRRKASVAQLLLPTLSARQPNPVTTTPRPNLRDSTSSTWSVFLTSSRAAARYVYFQSNPSRPRISRLCALKNRKRISTKAPSQLAPRHRLADKMPLRIDIRQCECQGRSNQEEGRDCP